MDPEEALDISWGLYGGFEADFVYEQEVPIVRTTFRHNTTLWSHEWLLLGSGDDIDC